MFPSPLLHRYHQSPVFLRPPPAQCKQINICTRCLLSARSFFPNTPTYTETRLRLHNTQPREKRVEGGRWGGGGQLSPAQVCGSFPERGAPHSGLGLLPSRLPSTVFMSLANPILRWNSGYLQTDSPALQVFDERGAEPPFNPPARSGAAARPLAAPPAPRRAAPHRAPGHQPAQHRPPRVRGCGATGAAARSATGHPEGQRALRRRPGSGGTAAGAGEGVWLARRSPRRSPGGRLRAAGQRGGGGGFSPPRRGTRRDGLGGRGARLARLRDRRRGDPRAAS